MRPRISRADAAERCAVAHFAGDDREPAALFARARRLDGRVEREQVRLERDLVDRRDDVLGSCATTRVDPRSSPRPRSRPRVHPSRPLRAPCASWAACCALSAFCFTADVISSSDAAVSSSDDAWRCAPSEIAPAASDTRSAGAAVPRRLAHARHRGLRSPRASCSWRAMSPSSSCVDTSARDVRSPSEARDRAVHRLELARHHLGEQVREQPAHEPREQDRADQHHALAPDLALQLAHVDAPPTIQPQSDAFHVRDLADGLFSPGFGHRYATEPPPFARTTSTNSRNRCLPFGSAISPSSLPSSSGFMGVHDHLRPHVVDPEVAVPAEAQVTDLRDGLGLRLLDGHLARLRRGDVVLDQRRRGLDEVLHARSRARTSGARCAIPFPPWRRRNRRAPRCPRDGVSNPVSSSRTCRPPGSMLGDMAPHECGRRQKPTASCRNPQFKSVPPPVRRT